MLFQCITTASPHPGNGVPRCAERREGTLVGGGMVIYVLVLLYIALIAEFRVFILFGRHQIMFKLQFRGEQALHAHIAVVTRLYLVQSISGHQFLSGKLAGTTPMPSFCTSHTSETLLLQHPPTLRQSCNIRVSKLPLYAHKMASRHSSSTSSRAPLQPKQSLWQYVTSPSTLLRSHLPHIPLLTT